MGLFDKIFGKKEKDTLDQGLQKTKENFFSKITKAIAGKSTVDDEVLAGRLVELLHEDARDAVDRSAGRKRHDHSDRPGWIILRARGGRNETDEGQRGQQ